jgi:hypothetical protein
MREHDLTIVTPNDPFAPGQLDHDRSHDSIVADEAARHVSALNAAAAKRPAADVASGGRDRTPVSRSRGNLTDRDATVVSHVPPKYSRHVPPKYSRHAPQNFIGIGPQTRTRLPC